MKRPQFEDLAPEQVRLLDFDVGPGWLPKRWRRFLTQTASWFFDEASWQHHDFGYAVGGDRWDRARCDWKFLSAMLRDARAQRAVLIIPAVLLALIFYIAVRIGGQFSSFRYRDSYATIDEVIKNASR